MEGYQGIALFNELEDLLGHDPVFYEETGVSSPPGDISKHSITLSQDYCKPQATSIPEFMQQHDINKQGINNCSLAVAMVTRFVVDFIRIRYDYRSW